jgi:heme/copper-type cytochrome/quinol oxidase subunit 4
MGGGVMTQKRTIDLLFLLLVALTLGGTLLGESAEAGSSLLVVVVLTMAVKGRLVIDYFMEMRNANRTLRNLMRAYFYVLPLVTVLVYLFGREIARLLTI